MSSFISTSWLRIRGDWVIVGQRTILVKWLCKPKLQLTQEKSVRKVVTLDWQNPGENPYYTVQHSNFNSHLHPRSSYLPGSGNIWRRDCIHFDHSGLHSNIWCLCCILGISHLNSDGLTCKSWCRWWWGWCHRNWVRTQWTYENAQGTNGLMALLNQWCVASSQS